MRCCEYYPVAITNGKNKCIYVENDYHTLTKAELDKELAEYLKAKEETIHDIEKSYESIASITDQIKSL